MHRLAIAVLLALAPGAAMSAPPPNLPLPPAPTSDAAAPDPAAVAVALKGLRALQVGAATGEWEPFVAMLADDVTFYAPVEGFDGLLRGKAEARRLFKHHADKTRTRWTLMRTVANGREIGFEVRAEGAITGAGDGYANNLFMLLRIDGDRIVQFREYAATTGYKSHEIGRGAFAYLGR